MSDLTGAGGTVRPVTTPLRYILFPGRHHLLTRFQGQYLRTVLEGRATDTDGTPVVMAPDAAVVWAVTSANHAGTRRNPVPAHRREAAIERFSLLEGLTSLVVPVTDVTPTDRFADVVTSAVTAEVNAELTPDNTVVACSTPAVAAMYAAAGFRVVDVEAGADPVPARPWDVLELLVAGDPTWRDLAHPATLAVFDRYGLAETTTMVCTDSIVGSEGDLTGTREYGTYAASFWDASERKWEQLRDHVRPGRIVDIGCASGGLLRMAGKEPRLHESDLIGIEVSRHLFAEAQHLKAQGVFENPNTVFYQRNALAPDQAFPARSVDTTTTVALTHEIVSYGDGVTDLKRLARAIYTHTRPGGVWLNSDVVGPDHGDELVFLTTRNDNGHTPFQPRTDLASLTGPQVRDYLAGLSTRGLLDQFAHDFPRKSGVPFTFEVITPTTVEVTRSGAMEFLTTAPYLDNWLSECAETFTAVDMTAWRTLLTEAGFTLEPGSGTWRNEWLVANRFAPVASLTDRVTGAPLPWPDTHVLLVARRPEHT